MQQSADSVNKIRATLRYLNGVIGDESEVLNDKSTFLNRYILSALVEHQNEVCSDNKLIRIKYILKKLFCTDMEIIRHLRI